MASESEREQLLPVVNRDRRYGTTSGTENNVEVSLREQDDQLNELSTGVRGVRDVAFAINKEVNSQLSLLDNMTNQMDTTSSHLQTTTERAANNSESVYTLKNFCILLCPAVLLIILVIESIIHFIF